MSTEESNTSNTESFSEMLRRSSARLRGGSVPPLDSEQTVNPPLGSDQPTADTTTNSQRGKSRGRGRRNARGSARPTMGNANSGDGTPAVTLTVPGSNGNGNSTPASSSNPEVQGGGLSTTNRASSGGSTPQDSNCTLVIHPPGSALISEDNVGNNATEKFLRRTILRRGILSLPCPVPKSPPRRNTVSSVVVSPPKGMHSWLAANGFSIVDTAGRVAPRGLTAALGCPPKSLPAPDVTTTAANPPGKSANPASRRPPCFDLTKDTDDDISPSSKDTEASKSAAKSKPEVSTNGIENTGFVSLSKHWHEKLLPLVGYVPLSIFNINWLKGDLLRTTSRPRTSKDKDDKYVGLSVPEEWKMSFGEWVTAFDLFVTYLEHYDHGALAKRFRLHKENMFAIMREQRSWPMAFRYDMAVRTVVLTIRNSDGKIADPGDRNEIIERDARLDSERLGDFDPWFADCNPYADGQVKSHIDPITGEKRRYHDNSFGSSGDHSMSSTYGKPNARSWAFANQNVYDGPGGVNFNDAEDRSFGGRRNCGRGRGGRWNGGGGSRNTSPRGRRGNDDYENRRAEGSNSWKREEKCDDRRGDERGPVGPKYGGNGKAK
ncbi:uncharacterized protein MELLADRAFT_84651 [Melampsora larici-populina 98AG31]|uniref:Uncharacterized protein n=1 Tax=Melampsora larici-populina (strain 98AG31 / pathotype 3-4-7) TaxID=747676 RepID=F4RG15_MELLP|nr:uncharacterized protein MELLADRAFT_84651 [Melampsora larici-populina 98AG31]EGG08473.1 hypothetical protein MELLADRAFT_84651 [Melampsora larici-populina 98AG31]